MPTCEKLWSCCFFCWQFCHTSSPEWWHFCHIGEMRRCNKLWQCCLHFLANFVTLLLQNDDIFAKLVKCNDVINCGNVASNPSTFTCCYLSPLLAPPAPKPKPNLWNPDILYACFNSNFSPKPNSWNSASLFYAGSISNISPYLAKDKFMELGYVILWHLFLISHHISQYLMKAKSMELGSIMMLTLFLLAPTGALILIVMMVYYTYIYPRPLFQIFTQSLDAIDVTSV